MVIVVSMITIQLNSIPSIRVQADLYSRWYATRQLIESGRNLYDVKNMEEVAGYKTIPTNPLEAGFFYPANLTIFLAPLAVVSYPMAHFIWTFVGQVFYLLGLWIIMNEVFRLSSISKM